MVTVTIQEVVLEQWTLLTNYNNRKNYFVAQPRPTLQD